MARPATPPSDWATSANYTATDVSDAHDGTPTKIEPSAGDKANGFEPRYRPPAQFFNWILGMLASWVAYLATFTDANDEVVYPSEKTRTITIGLHDSLRFNTTDWSYPATEASDYLLASGGAAARKIIFPINKHLRHGQKLLSVTLLGKPGSDPGTPGDRMRIGLYRSAPLDFSGATAPTTPTLLLGGELTGTVRAAATFTPGGTVVVVRDNFGAANTARDYWIQVTSTNAGVTDEIYGIQLSVGDSILRSS